MADEKKIGVNIDPSSIKGLDELGKKVGDTFKKSIEKGTDEALDASELKKKIEETFSAKGVKQGLQKTISSVFSIANNTEKKQAKMEARMAKHVSLQKDLTKAIKDGAGGSEILGAGMKLAGNQLAGMLQNMNPYIAGLKVAVKLAQEFAQQYQRVAEESKKFIAQNSLFTDKATMSMMQRTGQSATGAQGTNRALDRLGISFEDIQSGMVTDAQMKAFEEIRKSETARLETIAKVGGPVFESMQHGALAVAGAKQQIEDAITLVFAKSKGVLQFAQSLQGFASAAGDSIHNIIQLASPIISLVSNVLSVAMEVGTHIFKVVGMIADAVTPITDTFAMVFDLVGKTFSQVVKTISRVAMMIVKPVLSISKILIEYIVAPTQMLVKILSAIIDAAMVAAEPIFVIMEAVSEGVGALVTGFLPSLKSLEPILDVVIKLISKTGEVIAWLIGKVAGFIKDVSSMLITGVNWIINLIPKGVHQMIENIVGIMNKIPGVNIKVGEYKPIDVSKMMGALGGSIDNAITNIQGDTFNYNTTNNSNSGQNANQNLFANNYVLVND